ncbi:MarR family winged helix-turn-helix transcriptional regulator [Nocardioides sp. R-C-SC26]|uniref:MarR family winged helix-turn-helix transcriptional regulator n=1 Tax=Nocardioides sp. R-C-SC26 TaxID=2870414 RepID=UPI001E6353A1|nr:MarR family winged helix-turn-helix transcriptional regulator [Nocardioides sp. R-C-SC26]
MAGRRPQVDPLTVLVRDLQDRMGALERGFADRLGMTLTEVHALGHLADGPRGGAVLARLVGVKPSALSTMVDRFVRRGHVVRVPRADDRRKVDVALTAAGRASLLGVVHPMAVDLDAVAAGLTPSEREVVAAYLGEVIAVLDRHAVGPVTPPGGTTPAPT